jgi:predicted amidohydrolase YtcJ
MRALACMIVAALFARTVPAQTADLIITNAVIYTGEGLAQGRPQTVQAFAVAQGKILAAGTNAEILRLKGPQTEVRSLDTARSHVYVFPGFNDAHTHLGEAGMTKMNIDLAGVRSRDEMMSQIAGFARNSPPGQWLVGGRWDQTLWPDKSLPTRQQLDDVSAGHPAFLSRVDGHIALANTAALEAAHITGNTIPPQGAAIDLDSSGQPTGILRESAQDLVNKVIPPPTADERRRGIELAIADALSNGVTSVQDNSDWQDFLIYEQLEQDGKLNLRITEWLPFKASLEELKSMRAHHPADDPLLHTGQLKGLMDGSLGSHTAAMNAPYSDDPGNTGLPQFTQLELNRMALDRARAGFRLGFHAIGDKAASMALNALDQPGISRSARNRVEHAQVVDPADIARFRKLGVIASMQPSHLLTDMNWAEARLGPRRAAYSYAWKSFLDAGVPLAFGTDYPVEPISPYRGLYAAISRMNEAGTRSYYPAQKITRGQALAAYTQGSAYAELSEKITGKLLPGYAADFIFVDRDLYTIDPQALLHAGTLETFVAGRQVFLARVHVQ